jgi:single-strand DNA-binding protein
MASVNRITLVGNVGQDPQMRYLPDGKAATSLTLATTDKWKDKQTGEPKEHTEWHRVVFFGRLAEVVAEYVKQGAQLYIEGQNRTRKYEKDGVTHYTTEIRASSMQMLGSKRTDGGAKESEYIPEESDLDGPAF